MVVNTFFSVVYTFFFFCALLALIGPTGHVGDVAYCCSLLTKGRITGRDAVAVHVDAGDDVPQVFDGKESVHQVVDLNEEEDEDGVPTAYKKDANLI